MSNIALIVPKRTGKVNRDFPKSVMFFERRGRLAAQLRRKARPQKIGCDRKPL